MVTSAKTEYSGMWSTQSLADQPVSVVMMTNNAFARGIKKGSTGEGGADECQVPQERKRAQEK